MSRTLRARARTVPHLPTAPAPNPAVDRLSQPRSAVKYMKHAAETNTHSLGTVGAGEISLGDDASLVKLDQQQVRSLGSNPAGVPVPFSAMVTNQSTRVGGERGSTKTESESRGKEYQIL